MATTAGESHVATSSAPDRRRRDGLAAARSGLWQPLRGGFSLSRLRHPGAGMVLTCGIVVLIVVLMGVTTLIDIDERQSSARNALEARALQLSNAAGSVLDRPLAERDRQALRDFARVLSGQPDIAYVTILAADAERLFGPELNYEPPPGIYDATVLAAVQDYRAHMVYRDGYLDVVSPVTLGGKIIGAINFGFDTAAIDDEIHDLTINRIWQTIALLCIGTVVSIVMAEYFVRPIRHLVRATERLAGGELHARVDRLHGREMEELGASFNSMAAQLQDKVSELQESRTRIVDSEERVRREIAGHLHGDVQGHLLALVVQMEQVRAREGAMAAEASQQLAESLAGMREVIQSDIATLSRQLYPNIITRGIVAAVESLCDQFDTTLDLEVALPESLRAAERANSAHVAERTRLAAYRIAFEALTNAVKHAAHSRVRVRLEENGDGWLTLSVSDQGPGFDPSVQPKGMGLAAIRDYAAAAGGSVEVTSRVGGGASVSARLPLRETPA